METFDVVGALHVHTSLSDGSGSLRELAMAAAAAHIDFVLVADHNIMAPPDQYGWKEGVFLWRGFERSPVKGREHFLAAGTDEVPPAALTATEAIRWVHEHGGWSAVSHPEARPTFWGWRRDETLSSWPHWDASFECLEVYSYMHAWAADLKIRQLRKAVKARSQFVKNPSQALLKKWDELAAHRKVTGIGTLDNHARWLPLLGTIFPHKDILGALTTHLLLPSRFTGDDHADHALLSAVLLSGNAYIARDELAPAKGTRLFVEKGDRTYHMGDTVKLEDEMRVVFEVPDQADLRILSNGETAAAKTRERHIEFVPHDTGVVRAEAHIEGKTWILTNHIRLISPAQ